MISIIFSKPKNQEQDWITATVLGEFKPMNFFLIFFLSLYFFGVYRCLLLVVVYLLCIAISWDQ